MDLYLLCFFLSCCTVMETFSYFSLYDLSLSSQPFTFYPQTFLLNQTTLSNAWLLVHLSSLLSIFKTFLLYPSAPSIFDALSADMIMYWLLLRSSIVQSFPCTAAIFCSIVRPHLSSNHSWFIYQSSLIAAETPTTEVGSWREMALNLAYVVSLSYSVGILICPKSCRHGTAGFTSSPKKGVLRIFIALGRVWTRETWFSWQLR
jgi:hypothetical protein